jgi:hypothetical protein
MDDVLYQLSHPWHWLTYGQNATAVAAVAACLGLVGLFFYTLYTKSIMKMQESTARASITPELVVQGPAEYTGVNQQMVEIAHGLQQLRYARYNMRLGFRNVGAGAALFVRAWCQPVSERFICTGSILETTPDSVQSNGFSHLLQSENVTIVIEGLRHDVQTLRRVIVVETTDAANMRHQMQILETPAGGGKTQTEVAMAHTGPRLYRSGETSEKTLRTGWVEMLRKLWS